MQIEQIIQKYYQVETDAYRILQVHSHQVAVQARLIAQRCKNKNIDELFIFEAALLHDIGMIKTNAPDLGCFGGEPYICHGYLGREMLEAEGFHRHALVCERHTGVGLTKKEIIENKLPLPHRDMMPQSIEERIVCLADSFFSKNPGTLSQKLSVGNICARLQPFGSDKVDQFNREVAYFMG